MIAAAMGANLDLDDLAVGRAGDVLVRFAAAGATSLVGGQRTGFVAGRQVIVVASAMAFAAGLLAA